MFRSLDRVCSSYLQSTKKPQKIFRVSSSYPKPLHNPFRVFALLNLRLHRRVKLLVLESSLLEFPVLVISCHAAAAPSSSPIYHFFLSAAALNPYPYTTTNPYPYTTTNLYPYTTTAAIYHNHISTTNPSSSHIRFVLEINLNSDSCFLACVGLGKKESGDPRAVFRPKFSWANFFPYPIFRLF